MGEGKKFKSVEELARGKAEADAFINRLLDERKSMREDLQARTSLQDLVDRMRTGKMNPADKEQGRQEQDSGNDFYTGNRPDPNENGKPSESPFSEEKVQELIERRLAEDQARKNLSEVKETLKQKFGHDYARKLREKAEDLGMTIEELDSYAKRNPKAFYRLVELDKDVDRSSATPPASQINSEVFSMRGQSYSKFSDFEKLRRENPNAYWSPKVQNQLYKLTQEKGPEFLKT